MKAIQKLESEKKKSAFYRNGYRVSCELGMLYRNLRFYSELINSNVSDKDLIIAMTPEFQRSNDNWSLKRKIKFVENTISGNPTDIILFTIGDSVMDDCGILDGLQRLTAIDGWLKGKFPIFGDIYFSDLSGLKRRPFVDSRVSFVIHTFSSEKEAVRFYIDINEGITHSDRDIQKARNYIDKLNKE